MIMGKTPLRIGFFGGGTDIPFFSDKEPGYVLNTTIDKYIYLVSHASFDDNNVLVYSIKEDVKNVNDIKNTRIREVMKKTGVTSGTEIHSISEVPAGTGLGSSSSFTVGLLDLLYSSKGRHLSREQLAREACDIEINTLNEPIGKQDQYAAAYGGMNLMKFNTDGSVNIDPINITEDTSKYLNDRLMLFYLSRTRDASKILGEQGADVSSDKEKLYCMRRMRDMAIGAKKSLESQCFRDFGEMLHESWLLKRSLTKNISDPAIDEIYKEGLEAGALGGKVLGAGGGGFMLFYCEPGRQDSLEKRLSGLTRHNFAFTEKGTEIMHPYSA